MYLVCNKFCKILLKMPENKNLKTNVMKKPKRVKIHNKLNEPNAHVSDCTSLHFTCRELVILVTSAEISKCLNFKPIIIYYSDIFLNYFIQQTIAETSIGRHLYARNALHKFIYTLIKIIFNL